MIDNRNLFAVYEARVRSFDMTTMVATCVIPGVYGMEPIECPPFTKSGLSPPTKVEPLFSGDRVLVVHGENRVPEWLSTNPDWYLNGDIRYVNLQGDTMTGTLYMKPNVHAQIQLYKYSDPDWAYVGFYDVPNVRKGYVGLSSSGALAQSMYLASDDSKVNIVGNQGVYITATNGDATLAASAGDINLASSLAGTIRTFNSGAVGPYFDQDGMHVPDDHYISFGAATRQMLHLYTTTYGIGVQTSTWYARSAGGFSFHQGGVHSNTGNAPGAGGTELARISTALGATAIQIPGRDGSNFLLGDAITSGPRLRMHLPASGEIQYIDFEGSTAGLGQLALRAGSSNRMLITSTYIHMNKTAVDQDVVGQEFHPSGAVVLTRNDGVSVCLVICKQATAANAAATSGTTFCSFRSYVDGTGPGVQIGHISRNAATNAVVFSTSSDKRFKDFRGEPDLDKALDLINRLPLVDYSWKSTPDDVRLGVFAQDLQPIAPWAVQEGSDDPIEGMWGIDYAGLVPHLIGSVKALTAQVKSLQSEVAELRGTAPSN